ncbi:MAG: chemotaxis protein CheD [Victivallales bacterium]|nr:chemotaxis protein CheD [Victivallales bacterium]
MFDSNKDNIIEVHTGELKTGSGKSILKTTAIGSCIAVAVIFLKAETEGILTHIMFPGKSFKKQKDFRYAEDAFDRITKIISKLKVDKDNIRLFLIGGGNVLEKPDDTICELNIKSVKKIIKENNLPETASVLGGSVRRSVIINLKKAEVYYSEAGGENRLLWSLNHNERRNGR